MVFILPCMLRGSRERQLCCFASTRFLPMATTGVKAPLCQVFKAISRIPNCWVCTVGTVVVLLGLCHSLAVHACTYSFSLVILGIMNFILLVHLRSMQSPLSWSGIFSDLENKKILDQSHHWPNHIRCYSTFFSLLCWSICTSICSNNLGLHMNI